MNHFLERAKQLEAQMQEDRHYLHKHAEAGASAGNSFICNEPSA